MAVETTRKAKLCEEQLLSVVTEAVQRARNLRRSTEVRLRPPALSHSCPRRNTLRLAPPAL